MVSFSNVEAAFEVSNKQKIELSSSYYRWTQIARLGIPLETRCELNYSLYALAFITQQIWYVKWNA